MGARAAGKSLCRRERLVLGGELALFVVSVALLGPRIKNTFIPASDIGFYQVTLEALAEGARADV